MKRILSALVSVGLTVTFAALCAQESRAQDAAWSVVFGVTSGVNLAVALGYVAIYLGERAGRRGGKVASGCYGSGER